MPIRLFVFDNFKVEKLEIYIQLFMIDKSGRSRKESRSEPRDWFFNRNLEGLHLWAVGT